MFVMYSYFTSSCPFWAAMYKLVMPSLFCQLTSAPAAVNNFTISMCPLSDATYNEI